MSREDPGGPANRPAPLVGDKATRAEGERNLGFGLKGRMEAEAGALRPTRKGAKTLRAPRRDNPSTHVLVVLRQVTLVPLYSEV